jgi:DUF4097 and DUF4098 domain-containing protein YvlB
MTKLERSFRIEGSAELEVSIAAGQVIVGESTSGQVEVTVSGSERALELIEIEQLGRTVVVRQRGSGRRLFSRSTDVNVEMPSGGDVMIKTAAGDVRIAVPVDELQVKVAAGDVRVGSVARNCIVKSASGAVVVDHAGEADLSSASGAIKVGRVDGEVSATTASGDVSLGSFGKSALLKTASGDIVVEQLSGAELNIRSMSGTLKIGLPPGLEVDAQLQSLSGSIRNELGDSATPSGRRATLFAKTVSGDIVLRSAVAD